MDTDYASPGPLTDLEGIAPAVLSGLGGGPVEICRPVRSLVLQPADAQQLGLSQDRFATNQMRPVRRLIEELVALLDRPLVEPRAPELRVVGTCRHFAVIACALLRRHGALSRARCGFATYFQPGQSLDHWVVEHWSAGDQRWVRTDPEILGGQFLDHAEDLLPGEFLSGVEAWAAYRNGEVDASTFGVYGTSNFGAAEIRGNLVKDLACLNKVEMLPWDEWGQMTAAYAGQTGPEYDQLLDTVAAMCVADDPVAIADLYAHEDLRVPPHLIC
ncbi:MAG TPA: transglutaminase domain-containing protein [Acidimicrobiales bacterium]|nr:transglutaminase domain-containing protein [Acidimicrobiales bacterium]